MKSTFEADLWNQFGASFEMLENAILLCPDEFWNTEERFWYNAFHCVFFIDYYLSTNPKEFSPPAPFDFSEFEDRMPNRVYTKAEILQYLTFCKQKSKDLFAELNTEKLAERWVNESGSMNYSLFEILIYNMRHIQHHAAQLNLLLRQNIQNAPDWVFRSSF
ncbi:MAG TPA: DinB family protein [Leadbetterella sp.]|nr:DinB family protein [Leadbetterella sp.]